MNILSTLFIGKLQLRRVNNTELANRRRMTDGDTEFRIIVSARKNPLGITDDRLRHFGGNGGNAVAGIMFGLIDLPAASPRRIS